MKKTIVLFMLISLMIFLSSFAQVNESDSNETQNIDDQDIDINRANETNEEDNIHTLAVFKHLCNQSIQSREDFEDMQDDQDVGNETEALVQTALVCPAISRNVTLNNDFDFSLTVRDSEGVMTIEDANLVQEEICETDVNMDINDDEDVEANVCLNVSYYEFTNISSGEVIVTETTMQGTHFGTFRLSLLEDEDGQDANESRIVLNIDNNTNDNLTKLHIFNFQDEENETVVVSNITSNASNATANATTNATANVVANVTQNVTVRTTVAANASISADLFIHRWYPKGPDFVFICNTTGFTPSEYDWYYGDGHKLLGISNQNTYHVYEALGNYTVTCTARDGNISASDTININVTSLQRPRQFFTPTQNNGAAKILITKHLCNPAIRSDADLVRLEESANNEADALLKTIIACPTITNPGDDSTPDAHAGGQFNFDLNVSTDGRRLARGTFVNHKVCENDFGIDANNDNVISSNACHDNSHYSFNVDSGNVIITETSPPVNYRFGAVRFMPQEMNVNNDNESIVAVNNGIIRLNSSMDRDGMIMLHIYNFLAAGIGSANQSSNQTQT